MSSPNGYCMSLGQRPEWAFHSNKRSRALFRVRHLLSPRIHEQRETQMEGMGMGGIRAHVLDRPPPPPSKRLP